ncbi:triose-phosphate isomerase, partial [Candidatus Amesbacteria bacterium]|nr:triose-phosphate isomerase [Candidatus Amesbacteria bacterium]
NFKTYREATGFRAVRLAQVCRRVQEETKVRIVAVPQVADLRNCVETGAECWVQHVDTVEQGKKTGWITVEDVEEAGARGTLLNHSEHKLPFDVIKNIADQTRGMAFELCLCAAEENEAAELAKLEPNYIAYEPPELIGSREKSVASEKPEVIEKVVLSTKCKVLIGAGVHSPEDVKVGLKLGAKGILLATDVVLAEDPEYELRKLAEAFK